MLPAVRHCPSHRAGAVGFVPSGHGVVVPPQHAAHPAAHSGGGHGGPAGRRGRPVAGHGLHRPVELELSAAAPVQHQRVRLPVQHPHRPQLVQGGAVRPVHPRRGTGSAVPQLAGCARVVHPHQPALGQHPRPAGALPCAAGGGRIPPQRAPGAAGTGLFVRLGPAHLFS